MKYCKYCKKVLEDKSKDGRKKFCNPTCNALWRYHNIPSVNKKKKQYAKAQGKLRRKDPKYCKQQKIRFDKWRKENREHFNALIRNAPSYKKMIKTQTAKRKQFRKEGVCGKCGKVKSETFYCRRCR
ncbi:MAG: hypothetical protein AABY22_10240 [Nanoarchaeota archaeon]